MIESYRSLCRLQRDLEEAISTVPPDSLMYKLLVKSLRRTDTALRQHVDPGWGDPDV
jgi:hypothetical protein